MSKLQKNTIGFYPKVNSIDEEISINIISAYKIKVNKTPTTTVEVYYKDILLETTTKSIINLPKELINLSDSDEIQIKTYKKVFNFVMKAQTRTISLKALTCCSEEDSITISCSDTFTCV